MKYTFTPGQRLSIAGAGDFFRLLSTTSPVNVEFYFQGREIAERLEVEAGFAESFRTIEFDRVDITSPLAQTVQFETARGSEIRYDRGAATISGSVDLNAATLAALEQTNVRPEASTGKFSSTAAYAANTPIQVFSPAANANGVILLAAGDHGFLGSTTVPSLIAKAGASPSNVTDGEIIAQGIFAPVVGANLAGMELKHPVFIEAGMGLYFIHDSTSSSSKRYARWKAL